MTVNNKPKITVITVVLNRIESIRKTIEDTLTQSYSYPGDIVVDGGSSDGILDAINHTPKKENMINKIRNNYKNYDHRFLYFYL